MQSQEKLQYSRGVSRIAAGEFDAYAAKAMWFEQVSEEHMASLLVDYVEDDPEEDGPDLVEIHFRRDAMAREKQHFKFTHKGVDRFDCDDDDDDNEYGVHLNKTTNRRLRC